MNIVNILGNVVRDPDVRYTKTNKCITTITVACSNKIGDKEVTDFIQVKSWERLAEYVGNHTSKGTRIFVTGKFKTDSWDDEVTGKKRYASYVLANFAAVQVDSAAKPKSSLDSMGSTVDDPEIPF